jgi:tartrate dehydrogenase/decarboxylase/D-malate dehydrogenase
MAGSSTADGARNRSAGTYRIAVIPGDGIGREVIPEGLKVLDALAAQDSGLQFTFESFPWGCDYYLANGRMMPEDGLDRLRPFDAIYFGAVGWPGVPDHVSLWGLRLAICQGFDQYANVRPARLLPGIRGPLRDRTPQDIDFTVVRENTEGEYAGAGGRVHQGTPQEVAIQTSVFSRYAVERVIGYAFELARSRPRHHLTNVTKSNAQQYSMVLWDEIFHATAERYPDIGTEEWLVDAMTTRMVLHPETLDVVVGSNLHADILTDLAGALSGSLGLAPSANLNPERRFPSMFEPVHGSAPDIAGQGIADPIAAIWSAAMMLEFLDEPAAAGSIMQAIEHVTAAGSVLTPDLGGSSTTTEVGDAISAAISREAGAADLARRPRT